MDTETKRATVRSIDPHGWPRDPEQRPKPPLKLSRFAPDDPFQRYLDSSSGQQKKPTLGEDRGRLTERKNKRWSKVDAGRDSSNEDQRGDHGTSGFPGSTQDDAGGGGGQPPIALQGRSAGLAGSLAKWIETPTIRASHKHGGHHHGGEEDTVADADKLELRNIVIWSKKHKMEVSDVRDTRREFLSMKPSSSGRPGSEVITKEEFYTLIRRRTMIHPDDDVPDHLLSHVDFDHDGSIDFEDYLRWFQRHAWTEELLMPRPEERQLRQLAREQCMQLLDVERIKRVFDEFDTDGSQEIDEDEFKHVLYRILGVRNESDMPPSRLLRYWREVDTDGSGSVNFIEFLVWYYKTGMCEEGQLPTE